MLQEIGLIKTALKTHARFDNKEVEEAVFTYIDALDSDLTEAGYLRGEDFNGPVNEFSKVLDEIETPRDFKPRFVDVDPLEIERDKESRGLMKEEDENDEYDLDRDDEDEDEDEDRDNDTDKV